MSNKIKLIILFITAILFIFYTIFSEKINAKNEVIALAPPPITVKEKTSNNTFTINNICDCYDKAFDLLDSAIIIRKRFKTFEEFSKNDKSVKEIDNYKKNYQNLQLQCVEKYQRQMFVEQSCGSQDELMKRRTELNQMGIKI